jgi:hypothetical protein
MWRFESSPGHQSPLDIQEYQGVSDKNCPTFIKTCRKWDSFVLSLIPSA